MRTDLANLAIEEPEAPAFGEQLPRLGIAIALVAVIVAASLAVHASTAIRADVRLGVCQCRLIESAVTGHGALLALSGLLMLAGALTAGAYGHAEVQRVAARRERLRELEQASAGRAAPARASPYRERRGSARSSGV